MTAARPLPTLRDFQWAAADVGGVDAWAIGAAPRDDDPEELAFWRSMAIAAFAGERDVDTIVDCIPGLAASPDAIARAKRVQKTSREKLLSRHAVAAIRDKAFAYARRRAAREGAL